MRGLFAGRRLTQVYGPANTYHQCVDRVAGHVLLHDFVVTAFLTDMFESDTPG